MNPILESAYRAWEKASGLRARRDRYKRYTYGDQWGDIMPDNKGRLRREEELIRLSGSKPLTNNMIRQLVKSVVGRYRVLSAEQGRYTKGAMAEIARRNSLAELDSRMLEEFLISGCAIQRITDERRWDGCGIWIDNVDPRRFFVNAFSDPRGWDIDMAGMLHDMSMPEIINRFAGDSPRRAAELQDLYSGLDMTGALQSAALGASADGDSFFCSAEASRYRVIEVWTLDCRDNEDVSRASKRFVWHCRYLAPDGTVLSEYDSPYGHGAHPFVVKFYPLTDGEVHPFVEDVIDQQRHINRLIVMMDRMLATAAKGVLLYPMDQMVEGFSWDDITSVWARTDGVIPVSGRGEHLPQQVVTNTSDTGAYQLLQLQLKLFDDISGVGAALLGRSDVSARGADMLDSQIRMASIALTDIYDTFGSFVDARDVKALGKVSPSSYTRRRRPASA
ncbi:MAG: hypothetical protein K2J38_05275 [Muribaculaceae bacterium]|nr:hypothetical protein [Muribaculaceae bacterium]